LSGFPQIRTRHFLVLSSQGKQALRIVFIN
jgi:hypothetical protein